MRVPKVLALGLLFGASVATGCVIVTGSTDGYRGAEAGASDACAEGSCSGFACVSAADCGDGGDVCCAVVGATGSFGGTACSAGPCPGPVPIQLCKATPECGEAGACTPQTCGAGASSLALEVCGSVTGCSASQ